MRWLTHLAQPQMVARNGLEHGFCIVRILITHEPLGEQFSYIGQRELQHLGGKSSPFWFFAR